MTLPFRRRHHDNEGSHDRARTLVGVEMLEPLTDVDAQWLAGELVGSLIHVRADATKRIPV